MGKYIVKQGDTLSGIAEANGVSVDDLVKWNGISDPNLINIGQEIKLSGDTIGSNAPTKPSSFTYEDFTYGTAKPSDFNYSTAKPTEPTIGEYTPSQKVTDAEAALNTHLTNKPGAYQSQWQTQLDDAINKILNREKFSYDLNGDALYQQYKDKYIKQGKLAMGDAIGQASAMTGGYGNSYAQSVGQQAYNAQLENLNDIVPELYQMALDKYNMEGQDLYNQYAMLGERENADYGRYRDSMADWQNDRGYLQGIYDSERGFDYSKYTDNRNFEYGKYRDEVNDWTNDRNFAYGQHRDSVSDWQADRDFAYNQHRDSVSDWQNDRNFEYGKYADDKAYAYKDYENGIAYDKWLAEYNTAVDQYNENMKFNREQFDWQKDQAAKSNVVSDKGPTTTTTKEDGTVVTELKDGYTTDNKSYFDDDGNFKNATFSRTDKDGNYVFYIDGKEKTFAPGVNPYTGSKNSDILSTDKEGKTYVDSSKTFSNGYQPNNVGGKKLSKSGITDYVNGVQQNVWKDTSGKLWIWDGTQNKYLQYEQ